MKKKHKQMKAEEAVESAYPWSNIDDATARTRGYNVLFPPSVYSKLQFLGENEPGGPSIRTMVLEALEPYINARLAKHVNGEKK